MACTTPSGKYQYTTAHQLGKPGLDGTVYRGRDVESGAPVAVKVMSRRHRKHNWQATTEEGKLITRLAGMREEAESAGLVVPLAVEQEPASAYGAGRVFQIMSYFEGGDMMTHTIKRACGHTHTALSEAEAKAVIRRVLTATRLLHHLGWAHQDIKLDNLFLSPAGAVLGDFGLVRRVDRVWPNSRPPRQSNNGLVNFYPPELYVARPFVPRSFDSWSVGAVLYAMLRATGVQVNGGAVRFYYDLSPFSDDCQSFLAACLTVDPSTRPGLDALLAHPWVAEEEEEDDGPDDEDVASVSGRAGGPAAQDDDEEAEDEPVGGHADVPGQGSAQPAAPPACQPTEAESTSSSAAQGAPSSGQVWPTAPEPAASAPWGTAAAQASAAAPWGTAAAQASAAAPWGTAAAQASVAAPWGPAAAQASAAAPWAAEASVTGPALPTVHGSGAVAPPTPGPAGRPSGRRQLGRGLLGSAKGAAVWKSQLHLGYSEPAPTRGRPDASPPSGCLAKRLKPAVSAGSAEGSPRSGQLLQ